MTRLSLASAQEIVAAALAGGRTGPERRIAVAVCDAGVTTTGVVNKLRGAGFESVFGLKGGMSGWGQAGLPVVTGKKTRSKSGKQKKRS